MSHTQVIGIGNGWRRDDGVGPAVAALLAGRPKLRTAVLPGEGTELIAAWTGCERVVVVDAMRSGAAAGTIRHFDAVAAPLPVGAFPRLSHAFGLAEAIEMARILGRLPRRLEIYGIEAADLGDGAGLSAEVERAAHQVAAAIMSSE